MPFGPFAFSGKICHNRCEPYSLKHRYGSDRRREKDENIGDTPWRSGL